MSNKTPTPDQRSQDTLAMFDAVANFGGGPASPMTVQWGMTDGVPNVWFAVGLTKREHIAAMAMAGFVASGSMLPLSNDGRKRMADDSTKCADALLERLKK